jgi:hypothetical protein
MYILYLVSLFNLAILCVEAKRYRSNKGEQDANPATCSFHQLHAHYFTTVLHIQSVYHRY